MEPFLSDTDFTLYVGDVRQVLATLPDGSVDCVVTSPPYWGLRDYGTGSWVGGDPGCDHGPERGKYAQGCIECGAPMSQRTAGCRKCEDRHRMRRIRGTPDKDYSPYDPARSDLPNPPAGWAKRDATVTSRNVCGKCGARRQDQQLGLEPTPDQYVQNMVAVFREVRRVLADHGTCWVNLGDSYASGPRGNAPDDWSSSGLTGVGSERYRNTLASGTAQTRDKTKVLGLKPKDLVGIPWRVAFALQADGWYLRADVIWAKPNPMPESVTDRPTKAHEYVFLLSKRPRYWFDAEAVREPHARLWDARTNGGSWAHPERQPEGSKAGHHSGSYPEPNPAGRNVRSVWEIATQPYPEAHFATYPEELVRRCVLAGCPLEVCRVCGRPRERITGRDCEKCGTLIPTQAKECGSCGFRNTEWRDQRETNEAKRAGESDTVGALVARKRDLTAKSRADGWSDCGHGAYRPGVVLDPFLGSGTTAVVARKHDRRCIGIELNPAYAELAAQRTRQLSLLA